MARCEVCFRHCELQEGQTGPCGARTASGGCVRPVFYGRVSSLALDPIEKKPLARFHPGSMILSAGGLGCNLRCPFCQNHEIAQADGENGFPVRTEEMPPDTLAELAAHYRQAGNIGLAFTYNEPLVCWEYVRDTARLVHERGMLNVLVTNGCAEAGILEQLAPYIDEALTAEIGANLVPDSVGELLSLSPFVPGEQCAKWMEALEHNRDFALDVGLLSALGPYLSTETMDRLSERVVPDTLVILSSVAPFLSTDALCRLANKLERITLDDYLIGLECLQPFLGLEAMERLHKKVVVAE